jgi:hypothetical protein
MYAAAYRYAREGGIWHFRAWNHPRAIGQPLPILPFWLSDVLAVPFDLESTYE